MNCDLIQKKRHTVLQWKKALSVLFLIYLTFRITIMAPFSLSTALPIFQTDKHCQKEDFRAEHNRLKTFVNYPMDAVQYAILLARNGFLYVGDGTTDTVKCAFCQIEKSMWRENDMVEEIHAAMSRSCPMVTRSESGNIPICSAPKKNYIGGMSENQGKNHRAPSLIPDSGTIESNLISVGHASTTPSVTFNTPANSATENSITKTQQGVPFSATSTEKAITEQTTQVAVCNVSTALFSAESTTLITSQHPMLNTAFQNTEINNFNNNATSIIGLASSATLNQIDTQPAVTVSDSASNRNDSTDSTVAQSHNETHPATSASVASIGYTSPVANNNEASIGERNRFDEIDGNAESHGSDHNTNTGNSTTCSNASNSSEVNRDTGPKQSGPPSYEDMNILTARPKRTEYAVYITRLRSFLGWPAKHHLQPRDLAAAGFFYTGYSDTSRCFHCGGGLRNWDESDNVWVEHARWFPKCAFMKITKGNEFVDAVKELAKSQEEISYDDVMSYLKEICPKRFNEELNLKEHPAVQAVASLGFPVDDVVQSAKRVQESDPTATLTSDKVYLETIKQEKENEIKLDEKKLEALQKSNDECRNKTMCKICLDKDVGVAFLPCGHFVACPDCACALKTCPICRDEIKALAKARI